MADRERLRYLHRRHSRFPSVREVLLTGQFRPGSEEREPQAPPLLHHHHRVHRDRRLRLAQLRGLREEEVLRALPQGLQACPGPGSTSRALEPILPSWRGQIKSKIAGCARRTSS